MPGRKGQITKEQYDSLKNQGFCDSEIAKKLGINKSSISRFVRDHGLKNDRSKVQEQTETVSGGVVGSPDSIDNLLRMHARLLAQQEQVINDLQKSSSKERKGLLEVLIKAMAESRNQTVTLSTLKSTLDSRQTMYHILSGIFSIIKEECPPAIRSKILERVIQLRNPYLSTRQVKEQIKDEPEEVTNE